MTTYVVLKVEKVTSSGSLRLDCQHITRERVPPYAVLEMVKENQYEYSTAETMQRFEDRLPDPVRKNAVLAVDFIVSASATALKDGYGAYFKDSLAWITERFGGAENRLTWGLHLDERVPHLHILMMPLRDGRLSYNSYLGGSKFQLNQLQTDFAKEVGVRYGLERGIENSGINERNFHTYHAMLTAPVPGLPEGMVLLDKKLVDADQQGYSQRVAKTYRDAYMKVIGPLVARSNHMNVLEEDKEQLMKVNSARDKQNRELLEEQKNLKRMILENGPELDAYRARMVQEAAVEKKQKKSRYIDLGL